MLGRGERKEGGEAARGTTVLGLVTGYLVRQKLGPRSAQLC